MRVDETMFRDLDFHKLTEISNAYKKNSISMMNKL